MTSKEEKDDKVESTLRSAFSLFENEGQAPAALEVLKQAISADEQSSEKNLPPSSKATRLLRRLEKDFSLIQNEALLTFLCKTTEKSSEDNEEQIGLQVLAEELEDIRRKATDALTPILQELGNPDNITSYLLSTLEYNIALSTLSGGDPLQGQRILQPVVQDLAKAGRSVEDNEIDDDTFSRSPWRSIYCDMAFLFLECMVHATCGTSDMANKRVSHYVDSLFLWIGKYLKERESHQVEIESEDPSLTSALHELKFRMHLYKSRTLFLQGNTAETQRQSKKEMKSAMELLQHKLRRPEPDATSSGEPSQQPSIVASKSYKNYHQIALYLKANSEHLKGNSKKALKLCAEANSVGEEFWNDDKTDKSTEKLVDRSMHFNNLGIIHQSAGKAHLALYYYIQSLLVMNSAKQKDSAFHTYDNNGFICPAPMAETYLNASLCAAQSGKWESAYACMALCMKVSQENFARRARCWLYLSEACIGMHVSRKTNNKLSSLDRGPSSLQSSLTQEQSSLNQESPPHPAIFDLDIESLNDLQKTKKHPLDRALQCLLIALEQTEKGSIRSNIFPGAASDAQDDVDLDCTERIFMCLCYVHLELKDPHTALHIALKVLNCPVPPYLAEKSSESSKGKSSDSHEESLGRRFQKATFYCRREKVLLYACECFCLLGQAKKGLNLIKTYHDANGLISGRDDVAEWCKVAERMAEKLNLIYAVNSNVAELTAVDTGSQITAYLFLSGVHASAGNLDTSQFLARSAFQCSVRNSMHAAGASHNRGQMSESELLPLPNEMEKVPRSFLSSLLRKQEALNG